MSPWPTRFAAAAIAGASILGCAEVPSRPSTPPGEAEAAPGFALEDMDGRTVRLSDFDGKVRLIDFWATWCQPCIAEIPMFRELHETYGDRGLAIIAVAAGGEEPEHVRDFVSEQAMPYTNLLANDEILDAYPVPGLPTAFLIDAAGKIRWTGIGPKQRSDLESRIQELLEEI